MGHYDKAYKFDENKQLKEHKKRHEIVKDKIKKVIKSKGIASVLADFIMNDTHKYKW